MDAKTFDRFRAIIYEKSGISLGPSKEALVAARVSKRLRALGLQSYDEYLKRLDSEQQGDELVQLIDAISTNVTHFFREPDHFTFLGEQLKKQYAAGQRKFRIWCAASSTGEEPYSLAITAAEALDLRGCDLRILATDISTRVLQKANAAEYEAHKVDKVPADFARRYFSPVSGSAGMLAVKEDVRRLVVFRRLNLAEPPFPMRGPLDFIFCRNVMIYFDNTVRQRLLGAMQGLLGPGGYLIVGHTESLTGLISNFKSVRPSVFLNTAGKK